MANLCKGEVMDCRSRYYWLLFAYLLIPTLREPHFILTLNPLSSSESFFGDLFGGLFGGGSCLGVANITGCDARVRCSHLCNYILIKIPKMPRRRQMMFVCEPLKITSKHHIKSRSLATAKSCKDTMRTPSSSSDSRFLNNIPAVAIRHLT
jgi:hypothetical protein